MALPGRVIKSNKKRLSVKARTKQSKKRQKRGEYRVTLKHLQSFETTTKDRLIVMATVISFMLYPTISKKVFTSMSCFYGLMDGDYSWYLNADLGIACTSPEHIWFLLMIILPVIIIFVVGYPAICVYNIWLVKKKYNRLTESTSFRYAVFLSGYSKKYWYWESVTCARSLDNDCCLSRIVWSEKHSSLHLYSDSVYGDSVAYHAIREQGLNIFETSGLGILWFSLYFGIFFYWMLLSPEGLGWLGSLIAIMNGWFFTWGMRAMK